MWLKNKTCSYIRIFGYYPIFVDGDRLLIFLRVFLRFAVPGPYSETIYGNTVCVELITLR